MTFRLVPKSAITLRYFTEVGKPALQKMICGRIYARIYCIFSACTMSSQRKFTFAISSPDEFLVLIYVFVVFRTQRTCINVTYVNLFYFSFCQSLFSHCWFGTEKSI